MARYSNHNGPLYLNVYFDQGHQDIGSNSTVVHYRVTVSRTGAYLTWNDDGSSTLSIDINGQRVHNSNPRWRTSGEEAHLASGEVRVGHNADGTKSVPISVAFHPNNGVHGAVTTTGNLPLTTIPRASGVSVGRGTIGSPLTITVNRASSSFTHTLRYAWGSRSGTIATNVGTSHTWTLPDELAYDIPSSTSGVGTIWVDTYNGSQKIGEQAVGFTADLPDRFRPNLTGFTLTDQNTAVSRLIPGAQHFVQILSNIKVDFGQSWGAYGSTITGYQAEIVGKNQVTTSNGGYLGMMDYHGQVTIRAWVRDSRGRWSNAVDRTVTVLEYFPPTLRFDVRRGAGGQSATLIVSRTVAIAPLVVNGIQKNAMTLTFKTAPFGTESWTVNNGDASVHRAAISRYVNSEARLAGTFATGQSYSVFGLVEDSLGRSANMVASVSTEKVVFGYDKDGRFSVGEVPHIGKPGSINAAGDVYAGGKQVQQHQLTGNDGFVIRNPYQDLNEYVVTGFYHVSGRNVPFNIGSGYLEVLAYDGRWVKQTFSSYDRFVTYTRLCMRSTWTPWVALGLDQFYPVGAIYQSTVATDPATFMGGSWQRFGQGRVLVGVDEGDGDFNAANKIGGSKTHTLTAQEMPSHSHRLKNDGKFVGSGGGTGAGAGIRTGGEGYVLDDTTAVQGGNQPHNNLQPYVTVYMWQRTG